MKKNSSKNIQNRGRINNNSNEDLNKKHRGPQSGVEPVATTTKSLKRKHHESNNGLWDLHSEVRLPSVVSVHGSGCQSG